MDGDIVFVRELNKEEFHFLISLCSTGGILSRKPMQSFESVDKQIDKDKWKIELTPIPVNLQQDERSHCIPESRETMIFNMCQNPAKRILQEYRAKRAKLMMIGVDRSKEDGVKFGEVQKMNHPFQSEPTKSMITEVSTAIGDDESHKIENQSCNEIDNEIHEEFENVVYEKIQNEIYEESEDVIYEQSEDEICYKLDEVSSLVNYDLEKVEKIKANAKKKVEEDRIYGSSLREIGEKIENELCEKVDNFFPLLTFDFKKVEEDKANIRKKAEERRNYDSYLRDQVFDSCHLQGDSGLAIAIAEQLFPYMLDAGDGQPQHIFWHGKEICPQLQDHWTAKEYKPEKLFVRIDREDATFNEVIRLLMELDEKAAKNKRGLRGYFCCYGVFYGQIPKQSTHIEHSSFRHDLDKRIVTKFNPDSRGDGVLFERPIAHYHFADHQDNVGHKAESKGKHASNLFKRKNKAVSCQTTSYDHSEDFKYDNSVNTVKKILRFVKDKNGETDIIDAYLHAWKRLAGKDRWWFTDKYSGQEWIAVPWFWCHTEPTENSYLKHFDRCFSEKHSLLSRTIPNSDKPDEEAIFNIKASVLARRSTRHHAVEAIVHEVKGKKCLIIKKKKSFQEVCEIVWSELFRHTPDDAKRQYDRDTAELNSIEQDLADSCKPKASLLNDRAKLLACCRQFEERASLVIRAVSIVFERVPRVVKVNEKSQIYVEELRSKLELQRERERKRWVKRREVVNERRKIKHQTKERKAVIRKKAITRQVKYRKKTEKKEQYE